MLKLLLLLRMQRHQQHLLPEVPDAVAPDPTPAPKPEPAAKPNLLQLLTQHLLQNQNLLQLLTQRQVKRFAQRKTLKQ
jgi:hypothetical protein